MMKQKCSIIIYSLLLSISGLLDVCESFENQEKTIINTGYKGTPVAEGNYSFVVSVLVDDKHVNVGVIISSDYVLTEAYHYENFSSDSSPSVVTVKSGSVDVANKGEVRRAIRVVPHPNYKYPRYDLALIKVSPPFSTEQIAQLPAAGQVWPANTKANTLAWGGFEDSVLTALKVEEVNILADEFCSTRNLEDWYPDEQLCVASDDQTSGLCDGDYGAPLIINDTVLAGINIYNYCGNRTSSQFDRFIEVSHFLQWITGNMK